MYRHYGRIGSGSMIVDIALEETGAEVEFVALPRDRGSEAMQAYLREVPTGKVPALRLPDGTIVTETAAILIVLDELHSHAGLLPRPGTAARATALRWLMFLATEVYQNDLRFYYPDRYTTDPAGVEAVKAAALAGMLDQFALVDAALGTGAHLAGGAWSIVDAYLAMLVTWVPGYQDVLLAKLPALQRAFEAASARPSVARALVRHAD